MNTFVNKVLKYTESHETIANRVLYDYFHM